MKSDVQKLLALYTTVISYNKATEKEFGNWSVAIATHNGNEICFKKFGFKLKGPLLSGAALLCLPHLPIGTPLVISKLLDRLVVRQLMKYMTSADLLFCNLDFTWNIQLRQPY
jgi:hypothetical protein